MGNRRCYQKSTRGYGEIEMKQGFDRLIFQLERALESDSPIMIRQYINLSLAIAEALRDKQPVEAVSFSATLSDGLKQPCTD
jgi:hypothetical protein